MIPNPLSWSEYSIMYLIADPSIGLQDESIPDRYPVVCMRAAQDGKMYYIYSDLCADCSNCEPANSTLFEYPLRKVTDLVDS